MKIEIHFDGLSWSDTLAQEVEAKFEGFNPFQKEGHAHVYFSLEGSDAEVSIELRKGRHHYFAKSTAGQCEEAFHDAFEKVKHQAQKNLHRNRRSA